MIRLALRNLARNRWRSGLTLAGIAVAVAMLVWCEAMVESFARTMVDSVTAIQLGDARIETAAHARKSSIYDGFAISPELLDRVRRVDGVRAVAPRLETYGLLGHGSRSRAALVLGVDPGAEAAASNVARSVVSGAWLPTAPGRTGDDMPAVLGESLAHLLEAQVGDEIVVLVQAADGSTGDARLRVVGLARTGVSELDRTAAWVRLDNLGFLAALDGQAHELMIRLRQDAELDHTAAALRAAVAGVPGANLVVRTWEQLAPDLRQMLALFRVSMLALYAIIYFIAALGILNAQRMTALERRRELGVMMALGVTPRRLGTLVVLEASTLALMGAVVGGLLGWAVSAWHAHAGLDLAPFGGARGFTYQGVAFASRLYFVFRPSMLLAPALSVIAVGAACGLWPAVASARLDVAQVVSGRT